MGQHSRMCVCVCVCEWESGCVFVFMRVCLNVCVSAYVGVSEWVSVSDWEKIGSWKRKREGVSRTCHDSDPARTPSQLGPGTGASVRGQAEEEGCVDSCDPHMQRLQLCRPLNRSSLNRCSENPVRPRWFPWLTCSWWIIWCHVLLSVSLKLWNQARTVQLV